MMVHLPKSVQYRVPNEYRCDADKAAEECYTNQRAYDDMARSVRRLHVFN